MIIDAHQHVWDLDRAAYPWLTPAAGEIHRTYAFDELAPQLADAGVTHTVLVQSADNDEDTDLMLEVAAAAPQVAGVVVYVPLDEAEAAAARLAQLRENPLVVGVRTLIHDLPDPDWILRPEVREGLSVLEDAGVPFDYVAVLPRHLEHVPTLVERHPRLPIVIDHLAKPPIGGGSREPWASLIAAAAQAPTVHGKVSGLYPGAEPTAWTADAIRPFVEHAVEVFGPERLMFGGDWPVSVLAGGYARVWAGITEVLADLDAAAREQILAGTARRFYGLDRTGRLS